MITPTKEKNQLDQALKNMQYGYYIVAARKEGDELSTREKDWVSAATISWAIQSSFNPAQITIAVRKNSDLHETIERSQAFSLSILGVQDRELVKRFAEGSQVNYENEKVNGVSYEGSETGSPLLNCGIGTFECKLDNALTPSGDHMLFVGEIVNFRAGKENDSALTERNVDLEYGGKN